MRRRWFIVLAVLSFIGGALVSGIIGNLGTEALQALWSNLTASIKADWWPWGLTIFSLAALSYFWIVNRIQRHALITSNNLLELDDSLLRLLASWIPKKAHDTEMQLILAELLHDACREFGHHVHRAAILLPDPMEPEFLKIWSQTGLPSETVDRIKFYIGDDESKYILRGVAGETFFTRELRTGHMKLEKDIWRCDNHCYINFKESRHAPAYRSFVCMPIIGPTSTPAGRDSITCLGVVCFDSPDESVFDTNEAKIILRIFARRIAAALLIYRLLP